MNSILGSKISLILSMAIFGTIGIFTYYIPLPSGAIAFVRGILGALCLLIFALTTKTKISFKDIKANFLLLIFSGAAIGFNWIFLFEAYKKAGVPVATVCYYMSPVFVILASPLVLKERISPKKMICVLTSLLGMVLVCGLFSSGNKEDTLFVGVLFGLAAALLYATVILLNKKLDGISSHNRTIVQLSAAAVVVLPYSLITEKINFSEITPMVVFLLLLVGVLHTGVAYLLYFGSIKGLSAQTVAIFSYIDPVLAIVLSALILGQSMDIPQIIGALFVLVSALISELPTKAK